MFCLRESLGWMLLFLDPWELTRKIQRPFLEGAVTVYRDTPGLLAEPCGQGDLGLAAGPRHMRAWWLASQSRATCECIPVEMSSWQLGFMARLKNRVSSVAKLGSWWICLGARRCCDPSQLLLQTVTFPLLCSCCRLFCQATSF